MHFGMGDAAAPFRTSPDSKIDGDSAETERQT